MEHENNASCLTRACEDCADCSREMINRMKAMDRLTSQAWGNKSNHMLDETCHTGPWCKAWIHSNVANPQWRVTRKPSTMTCKVKPQQWRAQRPVKEEHRNPTQTHDMHTHTQLTRAMQLMHSTNCARPHTARLPSHKTTRLHDTVELEPLACKHAMAMTQWESRTLRTINGQFAPQWHQNASTTDCNREMTNTDHKHNLSQTATTGTIFCRNRPRAQSIANSDHGNNLSQTAATGTFFRKKRSWAQSCANKGHGHNLSQTETTAQSFANSDHKHNLSQTATKSTIFRRQRPLALSSQSFAASDRNHNLEQTAAAGTIFRKYRPWAQISVSATIQKDCTE